MGIRMNFPTTSSKNSAVLDRIKQLEPVARRLEPLADERNALRTNVLRHSEEFLNSIYDVPAYVVTDDKGKGIYDSPISEEPLEIQAALQIIKHNVDRPGL